MRTTIDIPDALFRAAKAKAALEGRLLKDLVIESLQRAVSTPAKGPRKLRTVRFPLIEGGNAAPVVTNEMLDAADAQANHDSDEYHARALRR